MPRYSGFSAATVSGLEQRVRAVEGEARRCWRAIIALCCVKDRAHVAYTRRHATEEERQRAAILIASVEAELTELGHRLDQHEEDLAWLRQQMPAPRS